VHNIYFEGKDDIVHKLMGHLASPHTPLRSQVTTVSAGTGLYMYALQIVPSKKKRNGEIQAANLNKYTVSERAVEFAHLGRGLSFGGTTIQNFAGIVVTYDFYPVAVIYETNNVGVLQFMVSLCAIVGGLVTVMSLLDKCLYRSVKVLIGKKD